MSDNYLSSAQPFAEQPGTVYPEYRPHNPRAEFFYTMPINMISAVGMSLIWHALRDRAYDTIYDIRQSAREAYKAIGYKLEHSVLDDDIAAENWVAVMYQTQSSLMHLARAVMTQNGLTVDDTDFSPDELSEMISNIRTWVAADYIRLDNVPERNTSVE